MKLIAPGEIIWDVLPDTSKTIGGAPFNFCGHLSLLGDDAYLFSAVGNDENGDDALMEAAALGVRTDFITRVDRPTGACLVTLNESGVPSYNVLRDVAYDRLPADSSILGRVQALGIDALYFGTLIQRASSRTAVHMLATSGLFREIFCDVNIRPGCCDRESLLLCLSTATILKISDEEAGAVYDYGIIKKSGGPIWQDIATAFPNIRILLYTMGEQGSLAYLPGEDRIVESGPPRPCKVVSTVGAGDSYGAAFLHHYMLGAPVATCIRAAAELSAYVVEHQDAVPVPAER